MSVSFHILAAVAGVLPAESFVTYGSGPYQAVDAGSDEARSVAAQAIDALKDESWLNDATLQLEELISCERRPAAGWAYRMTARVAASGHTRMIRMNVLCENKGRFCEQDVELIPRDDRLPHDDLAIAGDWRNCRESAGVVEAAVGLAESAAWLDRRIRAEEVSRFACPDGNAEIRYLQVEGKCGGYERRLSMLVRLAAPSPPELLWIRLAYGPIRLPRRTAPSR